MKHTTKQIKVILISSATILAVIAASIVVTTYPVFALKNNDKSYQIKFNSQKNKFHDAPESEVRSGTTENNRVKTELNNNITFTYSNVMNANDTWHVLSTGGLFYNVSTIKGIENISISFKSEGQSFKIFYSEESSFSDSKYVSGTSSTLDAFTTDFNSYKPNYFKFVNESNANISIKDIIVTFSCFDEYPNLSVTSEDTLKGTVTTSHSGPTKVGTNVTINAQPLAGYVFNEWLKDGVSVSSTATYSFNMGNESCVYTATFKEKDYSKYSVACMGDSITYGLSPKGGQLPNPYPSLLKTTFGFKQSINYGISGSTVANGTGSYQPMVDRIKNIDSTSNVIIFYGGGNDLARELPKGEEGSKDTTTMYGAFYNICSYLKTNFKDAFIAFLTPLPAYVGGIMYYMTDVIEPMEYTCDLFDIPVLDLTYDSGFEEEIYAGKNDGIHPTQEYVTNTLTPRIANFLKLYL